MAEMLIDGAKLDACNTAEADAIRAKTGGSSPIPYDFANNKGFADAIAAIPTGGGLPQYITKISSGSFTFASSTVLTTHIPHDLGVTPKFVLCWTDDLESYDSGNGLITGSLTAQSYYRNETKFYEGYRGAENRFSETEVENLASTIDTLSSILGADYFCFYNGARRYAAGVTYKWIAIA